MFFIVSIAGYLHELHGRVVSGLVIKGLLVKCEFELVSSQPLFPSARKLILIALVSPSNFFESDPISYKASITVSIQ